MSQYLEFLRYNVQSLANKTDILLYELSDFDTLSVPESCWPDHRPSEDILLHSYNTYKRDRDRYNHGGVVTC